MLEYVKQILQKVSFDLRLFEKELRKSISYLVQEEIDELRSWCLSTFSTRATRLIVRRVFRVAFP